MTAPDKSPLDEEWRPVSGFEDKYEVSDQGRVRSIPRVQVDKLGRQLRFRGGILKPAWKGPMRYASVHLGDGSGHTVQRYVHHLVLETFVGPRPPGHVSRHLNGQHDDNSLSNLGWGTQQENIADKFRHGTDHNTNKTHCKHGHEFNEQNTKWVGNHRYCRACAARNRDTHRARVKAREEAA